MASVAVWAAVSWILYFATGNRRFRPELDDRIAYAAAGIVILNFIIKNGLLVFAGIDVIGRLPTASAVVGDMISAVRFGDEPEKIGWSSEKLEVHPAAELSRKYFARFEGSERAKKEAVAAAFGDVKFVTPEGTDEFAVLTGEMTGEEFDAAAAKVGGLRQKIAARL